MKTENKVNTKAAAQILVGDVILPPKRELRLWMYRWINERGLSPEALNLTVSAIREGKPDKNGRWLVIKADHCPTFGSEIPFSFKVRPESQWSLGK
jgi:hypothetical protein